MIKLWQLKRCRHPTSCRSLIWPIADGLDVRRDDSSCRKRTSACPAANLARASSSKRHVQF
jgi:hypothetical protein